MEYDVTMTSRTVSEWENLRDANTTDLERRVPGGEWLVPSWIEVAEDLDLLMLRWPITSTLEMSKEQLALRLLCSQSEVGLHKVRTGYLGNEDWPRLTTGAGLLTAAPIMIDDSPGQSVLEIRAKCRRLKAENKLGLVVIDYLQLMRSSTPAENRVQEISQISRGLKGLAKELGVPIIALSQLSRAVEQRGGGGRPQLSDLRESGCLTADARVLRADTGAEVTMGELLASGERDIPVWTIDDAFRLVQGTMSHVFPSGEKEVFEMRLASGRSIKASANHPFLTLDGWRRLDQLEPGVRLAVPRRVSDPLEQREWPEAEIVMLAHMIGDGCVAPGSRSTTRARTRRISRPWQRQLVTSGSPRAASRRAPGATSTFRRPKS